MSDASVPGAASGGENEELQRRRKEKILASREDRLAKILSMTAGRTVSPSEVKVDPLPKITTPAPSAAVVTRGPVASASALPLAAVAQQQAQQQARRARKHMAAVITAAALFCLWLQVSLMAPAALRHSLNGLLDGLFVRLPLLGDPAKRMAARNTAVRALVRLCARSEAATPYYLVGLFGVVEALEFLCGRLSSPATVAMDGITYLLLVLSFTKLHPHIFP